MSSPNKQTQCIELGVEFAARGDFVCLRIHINCLTSFSTGRGMEV